MPRSKAADILIYHLDTLQYMLVEGSFSRAEIILGYKNVETAYGEWKNENSGTG